MELKARLGIAAVFLGLLLILPIGVTNLAMYNNRQFYGAEQFEDWQYMELVHLGESVGVDRVFEPIDYYMTFGDGQCLNASKEIRVTTTDDKELPSQVYNITTYGSGYTKSCNVVFQANCTANSWATYRIYYGNPNATEPTYTSDFSCKVTDTYITVENSYYNVSFAKESGWKNIPPWINFLHYKAYDPTKNLVKDEWKRFLMLVLNVPPYWFVPWTPDLIEGLSLTIKKGPVFVDVIFELGKYLRGSGVEDAVVTFRFYAWIPWFTYTADLKLSGVPFEHIEPESFFSLTALPYGAYKRTDGSIITIDIRPDIGDVKDWDCTWIDVENTNTTDNPIGVGLIAMNGTEPWYTGFRSDRSEVAPFTNGTLLEAHLKLAVLLHEGNYTVTEQAYKMISHPIPEFPTWTSILLILCVFAGVLVILNRKMQKQKLYTNGT